MMSISEWKKEWQKKNNDAFSDEEQGEDESAAWQDENEDADYEDGDYEEEEEEEEKKQQQKNKDEDEDEDDDEKIYVTPQHVMGSHVEMLQRLGPRPSRTENKQRNNLRDVIFKSMSLLPKSVMSKGPGANTTAIMNKFSELAQRGNAKKRQSGLTDFKQRTVRKLKSGMKKNKSKSDLKKFNALIAKFNRIIAAIRMERKRVIRRRGTGADMAIPTRRRTGQPRATPPKKKSTKKISHYRSTKMNKRLSDIRKKRKAAGISGRKDENRKARAAINQGWSFSSKKRAENQNDITLRMLRRLGNRPNLRSPKGNLRAANDAESRREEEEERVQKKAYDERVQKRAKARAEKATHRDALRNVMRDIRSPKKKGRLSRRQKFLAKTPRNPSGMNDALASLDFATALRAPRVQLDAPSRRLLAHSLRLLRYAPQWAWKKEQALNEPVRAAIAYVLRLQKEHARTKELEKMENDMRFVPGDNNTEDVQDLFTADDPDYSNKAGSPVYNSFLPSPTYLPCSPGGFVPGSPGRYMPDSPGYVPCSPGGYVYQAPGSPLESKSPGDNMPAPASASIRNSDMNRLLDEGHPEAMASAARILAEAESEMVELDLGPPASKRLADMTLNELTVMAREVESDKKVDALRTEYRDNARQRREALTRLILRKRLQKETGKSVSKKQQKMDAERTIADIKMKMRQPGMNISYLQNQLKMYEDIAYEFDKPARVAPAKDKKRTTRQTYVKRWVCGAKHENKSNPLTPKQWVIVGYGREDLGRGDVREFIRLQAENGRGKEQHVNRDEFKDAYQDSEKYLSEMTSLHKQHFARFLEEGGESENYSLSRILCEKKKKKKKKKTVIFAVDDIVMKVKGTRKGEKVRITKVDKGTISGKFVSDGKTCRKQSSANFEKIQNDDSDAEYGVSGNGSLEEKNGEDHGVIEANLLELPTFISEANLLELPTFISEANLLELPTFISGEDGNTMDSQSRVELFFSTSKAQGPSLAGDLNWRRYLSNFQDVPGGLLWDGHVFPNVEHAFHYEKYKRTNKPELGDIYVGEKSQFESAAKAKVFSGRKSMGNNGATLNVDLWNVERIGVNAALLKARWTQDGHFRSILRDSKIQGIKLVHFERGSQKRPPFWGALKLKATGVIIGENMLGKQMMELREEHY